MAFMVPDDNILRYMYNKILDGHLSHFSGKPFHGLGEKFVNALISCFNKIILDAIHFSPSGKRFHYSFNLRQISKVVEGVLMSHPNVYKGEEGANMMKKLFVHECKRVFEDRFVY